jgi:16S rRNA (guanine(966)-N(2))-methyltransferase RsmD
MTRKAVFDLIGHDLAGLEFLELFAGSGSVGFEALSLGARCVTLVERDPKCLNVIQENLRRLVINTEKDGLGTCEVLEKDVYAAIKEFARQKRRFDIIFADPPYGRGMVRKTLKSLMAYDILRTNCLLILQYDVKDCKQESSAAALRLPGGRDSLVQANQFCSPKDQENLPDNPRRVSLITHRTYGATAIDVYRGP